MGSPTGSGDSVSNRSAPRTPTVLTIPASGGGRDSTQARGGGDAGLLARNARLFPLTLCTNTLRLLAGLNDSRETPLEISETRRPIQLTATSRNSIFRQPSALTSRNSEA
ncbi:uncharacterized protein LOC144488574 [Mustelus asterias]